MSAVIDYRGKSPVKTNWGIPLITAKIVKGGAIENPTEFIAPADYKEWMRRGLPHPGDILVTTEAPLGEVAQLDGRQVALAQRLIALRGAPDVLDNTYLKFLFQTDYIQDQLKARATGTTVLGIRQSELRRVSLIVPPLPEQRAIASILGALDDKIELNRRMNRTLEDMARTIFQSWFVDFDPVRAKAEGRETGLPAEIDALFPDGFVESELGEIPEGWTVKPVAELASVAGGSTPSTKNDEYWEDGQHFWATPKDLSSLTTPVLLSTERRITDAGLRQIGSGLLPPGTVLLSSRAPIGYLAISEVPVAINQGFIAMLPAMGVPNIFLLYWAEWAHDEMVSRANGSTFLEISKANFRPIPLVTPSYQIFSAFEKTVRPLHRKLVLNEQESRNLAALRDTLLPKLISGELRVREAEELIEEAVA